MIEPNNRTHRSQLTKSKPDFRFRMMNQSLVVVDTNPVGESSEREKCEQVNLANLETSQSEHGKTACCIATNHSSTKTKNEGFFYPYQITLSVAVIAYLPRGSHTDDGDGVNDPPYCFDLSDCPSQYDLCKKGVDGPCEPNCAGRHGHCCSSDGQDSCCQSDSDCPKSTMVCHYDGVCNCPLLYCCGPRDDDDCCEPMECSAGTICQNRQCVCQYECCQRFDCEDPNEVCRNNQCVPNPYCFSAEATVQVMDKGQVSMKDLCMGDMVLTMSEEMYEPIYAFADLVRNQDADFLQIYTNATLHRRPLEITPTHLVYVEGRANPIPASSVQVGDVLQGVDKTSLCVQNIEVISSQDGVYAPMTPSGKLLVDGILVSNYIAFQEKEEEYPKFANGFRLPFSHHLAAHMWMSPFRMMCLYQSNPCYHEQDGKPLWVDWGVELATYADRQSLTVQLRLLVFSLVFILPFYLVELLVSSPANAQLALAFALVYWSTRKGKAGVGQKRE